MRLSEVSRSEILGKFLQGIFLLSPVISPEASAESLQGVVRLKGASSDGTNFKGGTEARYSALLRCRVLFEGINLNNMDNRKL